MELWKTIGIVAVVALILLPEIVLGYVFAKWDSERENNELEKAKAESDLRYSEFVSQIKKEVKEDAQKRKEKLTDANSRNRFDAANTIMRNKN